MTKHFSSLVSLISVIAAGSAAAASLTITNASFETDVAVISGGGGWSDAVPTGWSDPQGGDNTNFMEIIGGFSSEGEAHLGYDGNELGMVYQDLGVPWTANTQYTLTVGVGNRTNFGAGIGRFSLTSSLEALPAAGAAGGPYSLFSPATGFFTDLDTSTVVGAGNTFADTTLQWSTGAVVPAGNVRLGVQNISASRLHVDNFRLDASPVPEPTAVALLAGLGGLLIHRRRRA